MRKVRLSFATVLAIAALGSVPSAAHAYIYWTNFGSATIARANLDGSNRDQHFITGTEFPSALALDSERIYWASHWGGTLARSDLDGSSADQSFITGATKPNAAAVDGAYIFWANSAAAGTIGRATLNGSGAATNTDQSFITGANAPKGLAFDSSRIYWTNAGTGTIGRATLNGSGAATDIDQSFITGASFPYGLAVHAGKIYWANRKGGTIGRATLNGSGPPSGIDHAFITTAGDPAGLAVDANSIYWTDPDANRIGRADLGGSNLEADFITGAEIPFIIAVDSLDPVADLTPESEDFGSQVTVEGPTSPQTFTLTSSGNVELTIPDGGVEVVGADPEQFQITGGSCVAGATSLSNGQSCTVTMAFDPTSTGAKSATLEIQTNAGSRTSALTGTALGDPTIAAVGRASRRALEVKVGCGDVVGGCTLELSGRHLRSGKKLLPKTVVVEDGVIETVRLRYSRGLRRVAAGGGRIRVNAVNRDSGGISSTSIRAGS